MFKNRFKKLSAFMLAFMLLTLGCIGVNAAQIYAASTATVGNGKYSITDRNKLTVQYNGTAKKSATSASIPDTITINGKTYKVTSIANNALKNNTKINKLTIGKNITKIGKNAFYGCKNLKTITIKTTKLAKSSVGSNAFKGLNANAVVTVPVEKLNSYKNLLENKGLTGKKQNVKGKKEEGNTASNPSATSTTDNTTWNNYDSSQLLPDLKNSAFTIGDYSKNNPAYTDKNKITESAEYNIGDDIPFTAGVQMDEHLYGDWNRTLVSNKYTYQCGSCGKYFESDAMLALHAPLMDCNSPNYLFGMPSSSFYEWFFYPDNSPCKVVYKFNLPEGLSYKEGSLKVTSTNRYDISDDNYSLKVSGSQITVTIDDIKSNPFYIPFNKNEYNKNPLVYVLEQYEGGNHPINVFLIQTLIKTLDLSMPYQRV